MIKLPPVKAAEGLSLGEMVKIARDVNPKSWGEYDPYDNNNALPYEVQMAGNVWFSYDYHGQMDDLQVY